MNRGPQKHAPPTTKLGEDKINNSRYARLHLVYATNPCEDILIVLHLLGPWNWLGEYFVSSTTSSDVGRKELGQMATNERTDFP